MRPSKVKSTLTRRLAFLEATLERELYDDRRRHFVERERSALEWVLEQLGWIDEPRIDAVKAAVEERAIPRQIDARERSRRQATIAEQAKDLAAAIFAATRVT